MLYCRYAYLKNVVISKEPKNKLRVLYLFSEKMFFDREPAVNHKSTFIAKSVK